MCELFGNTELFMLIWLLCMKDLLGGGASKEAILVWVAVVQIPQAKYHLCDVTLNSHWGILICLFSSLFFIILHLCLYLWPCSTCLLSICQIFFFFFFCSFTRLVILVWSQCQHHLICLHILSVDHDWCLLATAFNSFDWVPPKNKRRFSFETLKLSSSYSNDSFSVLKSASPTLTRLFLAAGQRGSP